MAAPNPRPLDADLVDNLREALVSNDAIGEDAWDYWNQYFMEAPQDELPATTALVIANRFASGSLNDQHRGIHDPVIRSLFDGYDRTRAAPIPPSAPPPARDSPSPSPSPSGSRYSTPARSRRGVDQDSPATGGTSGFPTPGSGPVARGAQRGVVHRPDERHLATPTRRGPAGRQVRCTKKSFIKARCKC